MKKQTLLDITDDMAALDSLLDDCDGDITDPLVEAAIGEWFSEIETNFAEKVDNYAAFIQTLKSRSEIRKKESQRLAQRAKTDANQASFLAEKLKVTMQTIGREKVETRRYKVGVQINGGKQSLDIHDPKALPVDLLVTIPATTEPNKEAIRAKLLTGDDVAGATLMERGTRLSIR